MAVLFITCGVPGAGKTTVAKRLEREHHALRLTPDDWLRELFPGQRSGVGASTRAAIEALHWSMARRALEIGCNVVLDYGLWGRSERDHFRSEAQALGARVVLSFLDPPREELIRRLALRNADLPAGTFHIAEQKLEEALATFQRPTPEELALFDQPPPTHS
jgi:predicted kinase